jgi:hypothetical protein
MTVQTVISEVACGYLGPKAVHVRAVPLCHGDISNHDLSKLPQCVFTKSRRGQSKQRESEKSCNLEYGFDFDRNVAGQRAAAYG